MRTVALVLPALAIALACGPDAPPPSLTKAHGGDALPAVEPRPDPEIESAERAFDSAPHAATRAENEEIERCLAALAELDARDWGLCEWVTGSVFHPIDRAGAGECGAVDVDRPLETTPALRRLVELGPKAIPALLRALDDATATRLVVGSSRWTGDVFLGREIPTNPSRARERRVLDRHPDFLRDSHEPLAGTATSRVVVSLGDVAFVALGAIVNRRHAAVRYQPSGLALCTSPVRVPEVAVVVRELWSSEDPARMLFASLLEDALSSGSDERFRYGAWKRLLYYFPDETKALVVERIDHLAPVASSGAATMDGGASESTADRDGEPRPDRLIRAVAWSELPEVQSAIGRLLERTHAPSLIAACATRAVLKAHEALLVERAIEALAAPGDPAGPCTPALAILATFADARSARARDLAQLYLQRQDPMRRLVVIRAIESAPDAGELAVELLTPLLDDRTPTHVVHRTEAGFVPRRVCDEAAVYLAHLSNGEPFLADRSVEQRDRDLEALRAALRARAGTSPQSPR